MTNLASPPVCYRSKTNQLVTAVAVGSGEAPALVFERIYARLLLLYGVDVYTYPRTSGESLLQVAERYDLLDKVYAIAYAEHLYQQQDED